ncbi:hypothetical protein [Arthrobacter sp. GMC3]|uniref:hypothetical protein n=1 Tax=Arthrobacter sp. GMC3 TaxID=2058894 RepID=UPI000CE4A0E2|nr:hypothetical protein [Arthrobacter sp. GMC3]
MVKKAASPTDEQILAIVQETKADGIWCVVCSSDKYILIERARWRHRIAEGSWDVDYTCTKCDSFYGHVVMESVVTAALMASMAAATNDAHSPDTPR